MTTASDISIAAYTVGGYMVMSAFQGANRHETVLFRLTDLAHDDAEYQRWLKEIEGEGK